MWLELLGNGLRGNPSTIFDGFPRTERSLLSLRDISPPRGESPLSGEAFGNKKGPKKAPEWEPFWA